MSLNVGVSREATTVQLAFVIVIAHIILVVAAWVFKASSPANTTTGLAVDMILIPSLAIYATGAVKWVIANPAATSTPKKSRSGNLGSHYRAMLLLITVVFLLALVIGMVGLFMGWSPVAGTVDKANKYFGVVEGTFGVLFGYFYDDLFRKVSDDPNPNLDIQKANNPDSASPSSQD